MILNSITCFSLIILLCTPVFAQQNNPTAIVEYSESTLPTLNDALRRTSRRIREFEDGVSLTDEVSGILPLANGGTGSALVDPNEDNILFWDDSASVTTFLDIGTGLTITGTTIQVNATDNDSGNVIFTWAGNYSHQGTKQGIVHGSSLVPASPTGNYEFFMTDQTSATTIMESQWVKIDGVDTITVHANTWQQTTGYTSTVTANVGGQSTTVTRAANNTSPGWTSTSTIDVSGLTDGTTYTTTIRLHCGNSAGCFLGSVILTGS